MFKQILTVSIILVSNIQLFAQADSIFTQQLKVVEVTGKQHSILEQVGGNLHIINAKEIAALPVQSLDELLDHVAGVDMRQRGKGGVQADISVRGSSSDQVLVLLNGINITDAHTGHYNLNIPIDLSAVERIEVLQGSDSHALGATAFGGAINIITVEPKTRNKEPRRFDANAGITAGENGYMYQNVNLALATKATSHLLSVSRQKSDGYTENTDFDITNLYWQLIYNNVKTGKFQIQTGFQEKGAGANDFYYFGGVQYDWQRTFFVALSWKKRFFKSVNLSAQTYWRQLHNRFESYRDFQNAPATYTRHNYHKSDIFGGQVKLERFSANDKTIVGIDIRDEHIFSNKLGNPLDNMLEVPFAPDSIRFTYGKNRLQANFFANEVFYFGKFTLAGGVALNQNNDYGTNFSGGAEIACNLSNAKIYAAVNRTFRFPTYTDLYYTTTESHTSDMNLKPEKATNFEIGTKYVKNGFYINGDLYYRIGTDIIDWVRPFATTENPAPKWQSSHGNINVLGSNFSAQYVFKNNFLLKKAHISYSYLTQDKKRIDGYDSKYALDYLKHKLVYEINHKIYKNVNVNWTATWQDRNGDYTNKENERVEYAPFFLLDARLQWEIAKMKIFADFNNIANTKYADFGGIAMPQFNFCAGLRIKL
ncbi:MAG: TonB-dependent receptor [Prevotellaceae bacterium]|jgi:iron complex outermembrane receptor protein|nr:TonB-dependent receptor [Prevotellaceae bacterium]